MGFSRWSLVAAGGLAVLFFGVAPSAAQSVPSLGAAQNFAVLAASTVTNTGSTLLTGNLGVSPGTAVTGFPPGIVLGTIHGGDATAALAQSAAATAYQDLEGQTCTQDLTGQNLGGLTLLAGVYCFATSAQLTGTLILDAQGNANAAFVFKIGSTLTTAAGSSVLIINGGSPCNVFWQVGSSATLGANTTLAGNLLALASITAGANSSVTGRAFARTGAVTLDAGAMTATCIVPPPPVCPTIALSPATLPNGTVGLAYSALIAGSGGMGPYGFSVTTGALPAGLALTPAGALSGTPTSAGSASFSITGTDVNGCTGTRAYTLVVAAAPPPVCPTIALSPTSLTNGTVGLAYTALIVGSGGMGPYGFGVTAGTLPTGFTLTPAGALAGTPIGAVSITFSITGTDANGCTGTRAYTIILAAAPPPPPVCPTITISPATLPNAMVGVTYAATITGSGGIAPYGFGVTAGALPVGMVINAAGVMAGTPTMGGTSAFTLRGTDTNGCFAERSFAVPVTTAVASLPRVFVVLLALALVTSGYLRLRRSRL